MKSPSSPFSYEERTKWFHQARFGLFVHYGLYAILGRGEWVMFNERIPPGTYQELAMKFRPGPNCIKEWVQLAVDSGMRYAVLTTRHHDGFSLFRSPCNSFNLWNTQERDLVQEFAQACREKSLKVGFYYSLADWRYPGYFNPTQYGDSATALVQQVHREVEYLMTNYGPVDLLWYDGGWIDHGRCGIENQAEFWRSDDLNQMVYNRQPHILINNRSGLQLDLDTPEQKIIASAKGRAWESCMTIGDSAGWGYLRHNPNRKSLPTLLQNLVNCAADEGNFLINVGPKPNGEVPAKDAERTKEIGTWLRQQGQGIYGSCKCDLYDERQPGAPVGRWTQVDRVAYLHVFRWPGETLVIPLVEGSVFSVTLQATKEHLPFSQTKKGHLIIGPLPKPPHPAVNVVSVRFSEDIKTKTEQDHAAWLFPEG